GGTGEKNMQISLATKTSTATDGVLRYRFLGHHEIDELAELWNVVHEQHTADAPGLQDVLASADPDEAWRRRRGRYLRGRGDRGALAVLAERDGAPVGYAVVSLRGNRQGSWDRGERVAVVQTLAIHPDARGTGVASGLLEEVRLQV